MADNSFSYYAKNLTFVLNGIRATRFVKESFIDIRYSAPRVELVTGCDGEQARLVGSDESARIRLHLMQNSPFNKVLDALSKIDRFTKNGVAALFIREGGAGTVYTSAGVWVVKSPDKSFGMKATGFEWELEAGTLECLVAPQAPIF